MLVAAGSGRHLLTLLGLQALYFSFESAKLRVVFTESAAAQTRESLKKLITRAGDTSASCWLLSV